mmetsp:Transcript_6782/g.12827  ORF Transcript_6782/g.12827 Transcript_6782/m.12827 type:complete len:290 (-) Transcript_6782:222-1091(-)
MSRIGKVIKAMNTRTRETVIVKVSRRQTRSYGEDPTSEARILKRVGLGALAHPHIIQVREVHESRERVMIVMECMELDLFKLIQAVGVLDATISRHVFRQIASALVHLHSLGVAHLDLSPENILISKAAEIKLCDFGAAHEAKRGSKLRPMRVGKLNYMAPEVRCGIPFEPFLADSFSLGAMLFVLLFGHPAYDLTDKKNGRQAFRLATGGLQGMRQLVKEYGYDGTMLESVHLKGALHLCASLMAFNPTHRMEVRNVLNHAWLRRAQARSKEPGIVTSGFQKKDDTKR